MENIAVLSRIYVIFVDSKCRNTEATNRNRKST